MLRRRPYDFGSWTAAWVEETLVRLRRHLYALSHVLGTSVALGAARPKSCRSRICSLGLPGEVLDEPQGDAS